MINKGQSIIYTIFSGFASKILTIILTIISIPMSIKYFGTDRYGSMVMITSIVATMQIFGFSVGSIVTVIGPQLATKSKILILIKKILRHFIPYVVIIIVLCCIFYKEILEIIINNFYNGKIDGKLFDKVLLYSILTMLVGLISQIFQIGFYSMKKIYIMNIYQMITSIINFIVLYITVIKKINIQVYFLLLLISSIIISIISIIHFIYTSVEKKEQLNKVEKEKLSYKNIYATAISASVIAIISIVINQADNLIIPIYLTNKELVRYSISFKIITYELVVYNILYTTVMPYVGQWYIENDWESIKLNYKRIMKISIFSGIIVSIFNILILRDFLKIWIGKDAVIDNKIILLMSFYFCIFGIYSSNYIIYACFNVKRKVMVFISFIEPTIKIFVSLFFIKYFGLIGAAISLIIVAGIVTLPVTTFSLNYFSDRRVKADIKTMLNGIMTSAIVLTTTFYMAEIKIVLIKYGILSLILLIAIIIAFKYKKKIVFKIKGLGE